MTLLSLDPDQLLSTTRAVRKRLDFSRPVPDQLIRECVAMALQAPSGSNVVTMRFVVVRDEEKRRAVGDIYRQVYAGYKASPAYAGRLGGDAERDRAQQRVASSADYLGEHMGEAPVLVLGCNEGRDRDSALAGTGNILPAMWSFMLAARARGLGTAWTSMHRARERDVADVLGIPYDTVAQAVLTPLAYTRGTDFRPAARPDPDTVIRLAAPGPAGDRGQGGHRTRSVQRPSGRTGRVSRPADLYPGKGTVKARFRGDPLRVVSIRREERAAASPRLASSG